MLNSALASLLRWETGGAETLVRLKSDPRYPKAIRTFAVSMLAEGDSDRLLDGLLKDAGRNAAALCAAHLHFSGGLTLPRLKALCASFGLVSPGRARALLLYLRYLGYVERAAHQRKGAPALYVCTHRFLNTWRNHLRAVLDAVEVLEPAAELIIARFDSPGVFETYSVELCRNFLEAANLTDLERPFIRVFLHRNAGIQIVHSLIAANPDDKFPPLRPIPISLSASARRFGVSRIHVRRLIDAACDEGLLTFSRHGTVTFTPAGRDALDDIFATQMARFLSAAAKTITARPNLAAPGLPDRDLPPARRIDSHHIAPAVFG
ncbi:MAG TPA: hypothetical protein VMU22_04840 [Rhizomicrobium sp.]|nr:hypothetical protein [Rhizomicrobium sp.]